MTTLSVEPSANSYRWPMVWAGMLIAAAAAWLAFKIPNGILTYPDELFTAERSREMLLMGRGSVNFNFHPTFAKPPLQYWLTSFTLPRIDNSNVAVRIWPLVYGLLTAAAVGWLAFLIDRSRRWLIPLSVAIYVSCPLFSTEAVRALLDTGLACFTTLALCFAQLARRNPKWWIAVAIVCWLGALQKLPLVLLVWIILIVVRATDREENLGLHSLSIVGSMLLALALISLWPLIQFWKFGMPLTKAFAGDDLGILLGDRHLGARPYFEILDGLVASGWAVGFLAVLAAIGFLTFRKLEAPPGIKELSILSLVIILLAILFNFRSVRYVLPIVPCLSICLACALYQYLEEAGKRRGAVVSLILLVITSGVAQAEIKMHHQPRDASAEQRVARKLGALQGDGAAIFIVVPDSDRRAVRSTGFYLFHGKLSASVKRLSVGELASLSPPSSAIGVCRREEFPLVQTVYSSAQIQLETDGFVCWQSFSSPAPVR